LIGETVRTGFVILAAAHESLACTLPFRDALAVAAGLAGPFCKALCRVSDAEFAAARLLADHVVLSRSALGEAGVAIAFRQRQMWPSAFRLHRLYKSPPAGSRGCRGATGGRPRRASPAPGRRHTVRPATPRKQRPKRNPPETAHETHVFSLRPG